ncbi:MAG TPA: hypothetical protein VJY35_14815 [Candidatus Eisenbacteria bacterium]|nr:hypothetical protein [Candidatus Eisenbacteria bacterium]
MGSTAGRGVFVAGAIGMMVALTALPARAEGPWDEGKNWLSVRAGYAKSGARFAADGSYGYGFSYSWFLSNNIAWTMGMSHDLLGRYFGAAEIEVPITTEFTRHFRWGSMTRQYLGGGIGAVYHKTYRTGVDQSGFRQGIFVTTGANSMINAGSMLGIDFRWMLEQDTRSINPAFPNLEASSPVWTAKVSYSRVF